MASDYVDYLRNWLGYGNQEGGDAQRYQDYYNYPGSNFSPAEPGSTMYTDQGLAIARSISAPGGPNSPAGIARGMVPTGSANYPPGYFNLQPGQAQIPAIPNIPNYTTAAPPGAGRVVTNPSQTMPSISDIPLLQAMRQQGRGGISPNVFGRVDWNAPMPSFQPQRPQQRPYQPNYNQVPGQMGNSPGASSSILDLIGKVFGGGNQQQNSNYLNPYQYNPPMGNYD